MLDVKKYRVPVLALVFVASTAYAVESTPETYLTVIKAFEKSSPINPEDVGRIGNLQARCLVGQWRPIRGTGKYEATFFSHKLAKMGAGLETDPLLGSSNWFKIDITTLAHIGAHRIYFRENLKRLPNGDTGRIDSFHGHVSSSLRVRKLAVAEKYLWMARMTEYTYYSQPSYVKTKLKVENTRDTVCYEVSP